MRLHNPLDTILNNEIKVKLLRFLCKTGGEWSGRRLAQEIKASPAACHKALSDLQKERILKFKSSGRSYLYSLDEDNLIIKNLLKPLYKKEEGIPAMLANITTQLPSSVKERVVSSAIFGSISRKKERPDSDVDLCVIVKEKGDKKILEEHLEKINAKLMKQYGNILSPYIQTEQEFRSKFKRGLPLLRNLIRDHTLITGKPLTSILHASKKDQE